MTTDEGGVPVGAMDAIAATRRYREIAHRLPQGGGLVEPVEAPHLGALIERFDAFVLDGFGVLNVGFDPVPGAIERIASLRRAGRLIRVLTNGATMPRETAAFKYREWGFDIAPEEVVSSRDALARALAERDVGQRFGFVARPESGVAELVETAMLLEDERAAYDAADVIVLLGTGLWNDRRQALLCESLAAERRPVLVGNPDLVAPFSAGFSREPGLFAHALADAGLAEPEFFGKPFANAFDEVRHGLPASLDPMRIAMVGDTLHTDILGGAAYGWSTVLVSGHGLLRELDVRAEIERAGIAPDVIVPTT